MRTLNYARPGPDVHQPTKRFYFTLTLPVFLSLLSIVVGIGSAAYSIGEDWRSNWGWNWFIAIPIFLTLATAQAICVFALTPRGLLSSRTSGADLALLITTWIFGFGGSVAAFAWLWH
ncbi:MAG: hypothetical protein H7Z14_03630 [Anaerolineae bacterium]|nr:hypothetical protein [Phycisphaerae bacterium]